MQDTITFAKDLIDVLDYVGDKLGATIDWSSNNLVPYLQELGEKIVNYKAGLAWFYIGLAGLLAVIALILLIVSGLNCWNEGLLFASVCFFAAAIVIAIINARTLVTCNTFPEKVILDYLKSIKSSGGY